MTPDKPFTGAVKMVRDEVAWETALSLEISEREYLEHIVETLGETT